MRAVSFVPGNTPVPARTPTAKVLSTKQTVCAATVCRTGMRWRPCGVPQGRHIRVRAAPGNP
jgi:hypothetical protein